MAEKRKFVITSRTYVEAEVISQAIINFWELFKDHHSTEIIAREELEPEEEHAVIN